MSKDRPIWLTSLADADRGSEPAGSIEAVLAGRLRRRRYRWLYRNAAGLAVAAGLAIGVWLVPSRNLLQVGPEAVDQDVLEAIAELGTEDFVPTLLASEQPLEAVRVVRVSLPGSALPSYGVSAAEGEVTADLLVGQDGIARAIRVVK